MANETKVGLTAFTALVGVFGYVLYGKYEHRLAELAGEATAGQVADADADADAGDATDADPLGDGDAPRRGADGGRRHRRSRRRRRRGRVRGLR